MTEAALPGPVGVVGLGTMGLGMARTLRRKGFTVVGLDPSPGRRALAAESGVTPLADARAVATAAPVLLLSLPTGADVAAVVAASGLAGGGARRVVVDTTTSDPGTSRRLAEMLARAGHGFLDAPVSGGVAGAEGGTLSMMVGGAADDLAFARPVVDAVAASVHHVGASGAGNVAKLVNNLMVAAHIALTAEALSLARAAGVDPAAALAVVNASTGRSRMSEGPFVEQVLTGRFASGFTMGLMRKDVALAAALAAETGADLPIAALVARLWDESKARLADREDFLRMGSLQAR
ncbi:MAG: NAD(P)-dependent oxidoreductase [Alphaproteobacteria bacterium]